MRVLSDRCSGICGSNFLPSRVTHLYCRSFALCSPFCFGEKPAPPAEIELRSDASQGFVDAAELEVTVRRCAARCAPCKAFCTFNALSAFETRLLTASPSSARKTHGHQ